MEDESKFINGLGELKQSLDADVLQLRTIQRQVEQLSKFSEEENSEYLNNLLHPETRPGCKIPSRIPVPSTTFQLKTATTLTTNGKGCILLRINPWVLASEDAIGTRFEYVTLNNIPCWGFICSPITSVAGDFYPVLDGVNETPITELIYSVVDMGQIVPSGLFASFRIVSGSVKLKYIGPIERASGIIGGGITNKQINGDAMRYYNIRKEASPSPPDFNPSAASYNTMMQGSEFTDFNNVNHLVYSYTGNVLNGVRMLYFPIDNKYDEFTKVFNGDVSDVVISRSFATSEPFQPVVNIRQFNRGFWWLLYAQGLPVSSKCLRLELTLNYELMPSEKYLNYMPININPVYIDSKVRRKLLIQVAKQAVTKNKDPDEDK